jgi:hypothetical protein
MKQDADPNLLRGYFVVEVGVRQAWPYLAFASNDEASTKIHAITGSTTTAGLVHRVPFLALVLAQLGKSDGSAGWHPLDSSLPTVRAGDHEHGHAHCW